MPRHDKICRDSIRGDTCETTGEKAGEDWESHGIMKRV